MKSHFSNGNYHYMTSNIVIIIITIDSYPLFSSYYMTEDIV